MSLCPSASRDFSIALILVLVLSASMTMAASDRHRRRRPHPAATAEPAKTRHGEQGQGRNRRRPGRDESALGEAKGAMGRVQKRTKAEKKLDAKQKRAFLEDCMTRQ
jgi:hypothetical protein